MLRWDISEIRWSLFDIGYHQRRILLLQWVCVEIVRNTKCVSALCVCSGRGTVGPLRSTTFFHIVIENKCTWPLCGLWREVRSNSITRIRCDPTQHFNHVMISVYGRFVWFELMLSCHVTALRAVETWVCSINTLPAARQVNIWYWLQWPTKWTFLLSLVTRWREVGQTYLQHILTACYEKYLF